MESILMKKEEIQKMLDCSFDMLISTIRMKKWIDRLKPLTKDELINDLKNMTDEDFKKIAKEIDKEMEDFLNKVSGDYKCQIY